MIQGAPLVLKGNHRILNGNLLILERKSIDFPLDCFLFSKGIYRFQKVCKLTFNRNPWFWKRFLLIFIRSLLFLKGDPLIFNYNSLVFKKNTRFLKRIPLIFDGNPLVFNGFYWFPKEINWFWEGNPLISQWIAIEFGREAFNF